MQLFADNGSTDNDAKVQVKVTYVMADGTIVDRNYLYTDAKVKTAANLMMSDQYAIYTCELTGINSKTELTFAARLEGAGVVQQK